MATVYLSIGFLKTDATAVQAFLCENENLLKDQGYCFPDLQLNIKKECRDKNGRFLIHKPENSEERNTIRDEAFQKLKELAGGYSNIVLSEEEIWQMAAKDKEFWKQAAEDFEKIGCQLKVIVYLYRQDLFVQSFWIQNVQSNAVKETENFQECLENGALADFPLDYWDCLTGIAENIGKENLIVRVHEKEQLEGDEQTIFSDFLHAIGLTLTEQYTRESVKEDLRLNGNFIEIKRILNSVPAYQKMNEFLCDPITLVNDHLSKDCKQVDISLFAPGEQTAYLQRFEASNRKTAQDFLDRADGQLFYEPVEEFPQWEIEPDAMYEDILLFATAVFCKQEQRMLDLKKSVQVIQDNLFYKVCRKVYKKIRYRK